MARREIRMEELVEILRQWHMESSISQIKRTMGMSRKTTRKYIKLAQSCGFSRNVEIQHYQYYLELADRIQNELRTPIESSPSYKKTALYQSTLEKLLSKKDMTPKQAYMILKRDYEYPLSYTSFNRYIKARTFPRADFSELDHIWMLKLLQGKIRYNNLVKEFSGKLDRENIRKLYHAILNMPLRYRNRAITIFAYFKGISQRSTAGFLFLGREAIQGYIHRFKSGGVERLFDQSRGKVKKSEDPKYKEAVFQILHAPPSIYNINRTSWRMQDLQQIFAEKGLSIAVGNIRKIIKDAGYRIRKAKKVLTSNDPLYREKLQGITSILSNLGPKEKFFSIDEFGPFAVKMRGGRALVAKGEERTIPQRQKSKGSLIVTAALELSTNQITHFYSKRKNTNEMIKLLDVLLKKYVDEDCIYFSWDAASWHASKKLYKKVGEINSSEFRDIHKTPIVKLAPLPSCAQFLNVIESVFSGMARAIIHNSDYQSVEECIIAIDRYFAERNQEFIKNPKRAGKKIWGEEIVMPIFKECNNCKDPKWR